MSSPTHQCEFCETTFSNAGNLNQHQKTAKYCLKIREELLKVIYSCEYCPYSTGRKSDWTRHDSICKFKKEHDDNTQRAMADKMIELESKIEKIEKSTSNTTINNNVTFNLQINYSKQILESYSVLKSKFGEIIEKLDYKPYFIRGAEGISEFMAEKILNYEGKQYYSCYDRTGNTFHRKQQEDIEIDDRAKMLLDDALPLIKKRCQRICIEQSEFLTYETQEIKLKNPKNPKKYNEAVETQLKLEEEDMGRLNDIYKLQKIGSPEREKCIRLIAETYFVSRMKVLLPIVEAKSAPVLDS